MRNAAKAYQQQQPTPSLESFVPLVRRIASKMHPRLPERVEIGDLVQAGCEGLLQAWGRWSPDGGASFETFAGTRIKGAMLDWLRQEDMLPKRERANAKKIDAALRALRQELAREPREEEIAQKLGWGLGELQAQLSLGGAHVLSYDELDLDSPIEGVAEERNAYDPLESAIARDQAKKLCARVELLPEKERLVLSLYHEGDLTFKEIGLTLDLSEARVCQLHGQAIARLRSHFNGSESSSPAAKNASKG